MTSDDQLSGGTEKTLQTTSAKPNVHQKIVMVTVWWSAAHLIYYNFANPGKTITSEKYAQQINVMHWKENICSQHWSMEWAQFLSMTTPDCMVAQPVLQKFDDWTVKFCLICRIHLTSRQPTTTSVILTTFGKEKCFHNQQKADSDFQEFVESWSMDFYTIGINKLTFCWQSVLMVMVPIFINKDAFEPSYNDLKLTVWNSSYCCTNLIPDTFLSTLHVLICEVGIIPVLSIWKLE